MYEQFRLEGMRLYLKTINMQEKVDSNYDVKRGDIGSTSTAYAIGHLGKVNIGGKDYRGFDEDFITVNPIWAQMDNTFIDVCKQENKGLFILVKTSNPSSGEFQDQLINGRPLYELVGKR